MMRIILMWYCIVVAVAAAFVGGFLGFTATPRSQTPLKAGKRELFNIGTWLRKRYSSYFDTYYQPDVSFSLHSHLLQSRQFINLLILNNYFYLNRWCMPRLLV